MGQVIWSSGALEDIELIAAFIARDSQDRAAMFVQKLIVASDRLVNYPKIGRVTPEIGLDDHRQIVVGNFRLMYRVVGEDVWITAVVHGARDWPNSPE